MDDVMTIQSAMVTDRNRNITNTIKAYSKRLFGFIRQRVASKEDAEDILQDVFYQFAGNADEIEQVSSWLFTVARNKVTDSYRKQKLPLIDDLSFAASQDEERFDWKEFLLPDNQTPETAYLRNLFWEEMQQALDELPAEQCEVFIQNELEDIPFKVIAEQTGVSVATLISRKRYAVLHLRERLLVLKEELMKY